MINIYTTGRLLATFVGTIAFTITGINSAQAAKFSSINIFGDSLSDQGNMFNLSGGLVPAPPEYYYQGRFSNGEIWTDYLAKDLGLKPTLYTTGIPSSEGVNYAFGGATSGDTNIINKLISDLPALPGVQQEIGAFIQPLLQQNQSADPNGLYMIWAGANDYTYGGVDITGTQGVVNNLSWAINSLYSVGARNFLIGNLPDLSKTPLGSSNPGNLKDTVQKHNTLLNQEIKDLNQSLFNSNIALFDANNLFNDLIKNYSDYGLTNVSAGCLLVGCTNPNEYLFWDDFHPTTKGHKLIADAAYATVKKEFKSTPEPSTIFALTGLGLGLLLLKRNKIPTS